MADLELRLLGDFELLDRARGSLRVPPGRMRALLARLAFRPGRSRARGDLAGLLWPGRPERLARHSLNQALSQLRGTLGPTAFVQDGEQLALNPDVVNSDVEEIRRLVRDGSEAALNRAAELCRGTILEGVELDVAEFEEWLRTARAEAEDLMITVHEARLAAVATGGDPDRKVALAERLAAADPLNERAHRALIEAMATRGDLTRAIHVYEDFRDRLARELGIAPQRETERLVEASRNRRIALAEPAGAERKPAPGSRHPTLFVEPLRLLGEGAHGLVVADGVTHDLITELVRFRSLDVIAAESAFSCRDSDLTLEELCRRFGADYALTGGLRCDTRSARVTLQLLEMASGRELWSERYDCALGELFDVRDDVIAAIAGTVASRIEHDLMRGLRRKPTHSWDAYDHFLRGLDIYYRRWSAPDAPETVKPLFEKAIELDPEFARAHAFLACVSCHVGHTDRMDGDFGHPIDCARRAIAIEPLEADGPRVLGAIYVTLGHHEEGYPHLARAIRLNPGHADLAAHMCRYYGLTGDPERALREIERAHRLNPLHPDWYWSLAALAHHARGDYPEALAALRQMSDPTATEHLYAAACHAAMGETARGREAVARALADAPGLSRQSVALRLPYKDSADRAEILDQLGRVGLPRDCS